MKHVAIGRLKLSSPAFASNTPIPDRYCCKGMNLNPPIAVGEMPRDTRSLVVIMEDPDAQKGTFDHWVAWNVPAANIEEGSKPGIAGKNGAGNSGYTGPCPPAGTGTHHYHIKVYAVDSMLPVEMGASKDEVLAAMKSHVLAEGEFVGLKGNE